MTERDYGCITNISFDQCRIILHYALLSTVFSAVLKRRKSGDYTLYFLKSYFKASKLVLYLQADTAVDVSGDVALALAC